ncbi:DNA-binding response regulator [Alteromonas sp. KUL156]|nr:DNA-binding response regulator [Alteromonas sp. KUL154]GFE02668.1 DNA-binding response regulator [Alteromonas sp. KUL156]
MSQTILLVEDDANIRQMLSIALGAEGYQCIGVASVREALSTFTQHHPDLVILDLGLPDGEGSEVLKRIRESSRLPVLVLSARDQEIDKVDLLSRGANDYVSKPFGVRELVARVKVLLRDFNPIVEPTIPTRKMGKIELNISERRLLVEGHSIALAPKEVQLLDELTKHPGAFVSQQELLRRIWGLHHSEDTHYIRILVRQLRKKVDPFYIGLIETMPKQGYRIMVNKPEAN